MIEAMETVKAPWQRVKTPVQIPALVTAQQLLDLDEMTFSELLRSNLLPRPGEEERGRWERLWRILRGNDDLADRGLDVLDAWADATDVALRNGELDAASAARIRKFQISCEQARDRIDVDTGSPLAWAGTRTNYPEQAQRVINRLVQAIHRHRGATGAEATQVDQELWKVLRAVKLDPLDYS